MNFSLLVRTKIDGMRFRLRMLKEAYHLSLFEKRPAPLVIFSLDGRYFDRGFVDRLRGMVTTYAYCKLTGREFRIDHVSPFLLQDYFAPNKVDWRLKEGEKSYNLLYANPLIIYKKSKLKKSLCGMSKSRQYHLYCSEYVDEFNRAMGTDYKFPELFQELFKPSEKLLEIVKPYRSYIDEGYISASFRFMELLGDFQDERRCVISPEEQEDYITRSLEAIRRLHDENPDTKILVTSDSARFVKRASEFSFVITLPGEIGHIGFAFSEAVINKTMLDFYMLSQAKKVYHFRTGAMYGGAFSHIASLSNAVPYKFVEY